MDSAVDPLTQQLRRDEGVYFEAYPDPLSPLGRACVKRGLKVTQYTAITNWQEMSGSPWTIGVGHTGPEVRKGLVWTDAQINAALIKDIDQHDKALYFACPWVLNFDDARKGVFRNMAFNMGVAKLLKFNQTLACAKARDWQGVSDHMLDSLWARQVGLRANRLSEQILTGEWQ